MRGSFILVAAFWASSVLGQQAEVDWLRTHSHPESTAMSGKAIVVNDMGESFVAAQYRVQKHNLRMLKYGAEGDELWQWDFTDSFGAIVVSLLGPSPTLILTAMVTRVQGDETSVWSIDPGNGNQLWRRDVPMVWRTTVHTGSDIVIWGSTVEADPRLFLCASFDSGGNERWRRSYNFSFECTAVHAVAAGSGAMYAVGAVRRPDFADQLILMKIDLQDGDILWHRVFESEYSRAFPMQLLLASDNGVYVFAQIVSDRGSHTGILKYDPDGEGVFLRKQNYNEFVIGATLHPEHEILIATVEFGLHSYTLEGDHQWSSHATSEHTIRQYGVGFDNSGRAYFVSGLHSTTSTDFGLEMVTPQGIGKDILRYNGSQDDFDVAEAVAVDQNGTVYVTGSSMVFGIGEVMTTMKLIPPPEQPCLFLRGDPNEDLSQDISDAVSILLRLFGGLPLPSCVDTLDTNDDGLLNIADPIVLLQYVFQGASPIAEPYQACGEDTTVDGLICAGFEPCEY